MGPLNTIAARKIGPLGTSLLGQEQVFVGAVGPGPIFAASQYLVFTRYTICQHNS